MVWKSTTKLGCGVATCSIFPPPYGPAQYHVCHYGPAVRPKYPCDLQSRADKILRISGQCHRRVPVSSMILVSRLTLSDMDPSLIDKTFDKQAVSIVCNLYGEIFLNALNPFQCGLFIELSESESISCPPCRVLSCNRILHTFAAPTPTWVVRALQQSHICWWRRGKARFPRYDLVWRCYE